MRREIVEYLDAGGQGLDPAARAAVARLAPSTASRSPSPKGGGER